MNGEKPANRKSRPLGSSLEQHTVRKTHRQTQASKEANTEAEGGIRHRG